MKPIERRRLVALVKRLSNEARRCQMKSIRLSPTAGHSNDAEGTGDEGWNEMWHLDGEAAGLRHASYELIKLIEELSK
jgi:hypothetical protein